MTSIWILCRTGAGWSLADPRAFSNKDWAYEEYRRLNREELRRNLFYVQEGSGSVEKWFSSRGLNRYGLTRQEFEDKIETISLNNKDLDELFRSIHNRWWYLTAIELDEEERVP